MKTAMVAAAAAAVLFGFAGAWGWLAGAVALFVVLYVIDLGVNYQGICWGCGGTGRGWLSRAKASHPHGACGGTGRRTRVGAKFVNPRLKGDK